MGAVDIGMLIALVGCFVGLAGWLAGWDKRISSDARWKGETTQNLKDIKDGVSGIGERMAKMEGAVSNHETRIAVVESKIGIDNEKQ